MTPEIISLVAGAAALAIAGGLIQKHIIGRATVREILNYASVAVQAAEELYDGMDSAGQQKMTYSLNRVMDKFGIDKVEAEAFIHGALVGLRQAGIKGPLDNQVKRAQEHVAAMAAASQKASAGSKPLTVLGPTGRQDD